ncbi:MAG: PDZ domain-containing protein [Planctomycetes bacterium]|nr:PDZ domain-containing protein [Planctomycetota bacterium]
MRIVALSLAAVLVGAFSDFVQAQHYTARFFTSFGSPRKLQKLAFSPTSEHLAVAVDGGPLIVIATASGDVAREFDMKAHTVQWSRDGARLLTFSDQGTKLLNLASAEMNDVQWAIPPGYLGWRLKQQLGKLVVESLIEGGPAAESSKVQVGDELTGVMVNGRSRSLLGRSVADAVKELAGPAGTPVTLQMVPRGSTTPVEVVLRRKAGTLEGNQIVFRDTSAGSSPEACVVADDDSLLLFNAKTAEVISMLQPLDVELIGLNVVSQDGRYLALMARLTKRRNDGAGLGIEIFDVQGQTRKQFTVYDGSNPKALRFSPDGRRLLIADYDRVEVYDVEQNAFLKPILVGFDPDAATRQVDKPPLIDVRPDFGTRRAGAARVRSQEQLIMSGDISLDGKLVAVGSQHAQCLVWSTERHECLAKLGERAKSYDLVEQTTISPDNRWVAYFVEGTLNIVGVKELLAAARTAKGN